MKICPICGQEIARNCPHYLYEQKKTCGKPNCVNEYKSIEYANRVKSSKEAAVTNSRFCCRCEIKFGGAVYNTKPHEHNGKLYCEECLTIIL